MVVLRPEHLAAGCPICLHQIELAHDAALEHEALRIAAEFAEKGWTPEVRGAEVPGE